LLHSSLLNYYLEHFNVWLLKCFGNNLKEIIPLILYCFYHSAAKFGATYTTVWRMFNRLVMAIYAVEMYSSTGGLWFFSWIDPIWAPDSYPKTILNSGLISRRYSNLKVVLRGIRPRGTKNRFSDRGLFKHGSYMPWVVYFMHADNLWKVSF
jgi:hypothetical protein